MDPRAKIPAMALLGLQFTSACEPDDPIVGVWSATQIGDDLLPYDEMDGPYSLHAEVELRIDEDLTGLYVRRVEEEAPGVATYYEEAEDLTVIPGEGAKYRIEVVQPNGYYGPYAPPEQDGPQLLVLDCELASSQLRCTNVENPMIEYRWRKD